MFESSIWSSCVLSGFLPQSNNKQIRAFKGSLELLRVSLSDLSGGGGVNSSDHCIRLQHP